MVNRIRIVRPPKSRPFLEKNLTLTPFNRTLMNGLVDALDLFGDGSPEGVQPSKSPRIYFDDVNRFIYAKFLDAIDGDNTKGWFLISKGSAGAADSNVSVTTTYQVLDGNVNIDCNGTFTVTFIASAQAENQEATIKNSGTGIITVAADVTIEGSNTLTSTQSLTWFYSNNTWHAK